MYTYTERFNGMCEIHTPSGDLLCIVTNFVDADALLQHLNNT